MKISTVTVVGANGTMGRNVSAIFASFGNAKVYMVARTLKQAQVAAEKAYCSVKAITIRKNCIPADYSMLPECIKKSDLVFESVKEDFDIKSAVTKEIALYVSENAICVSGTSGLSLTALAEFFPERLRKNYMGMHMFNPPYSMVLCELTPTKYTDRTMFESVQKYAKEVLLRTPVEVKDSPAFLGNRIGFQFINEVMQYAEYYKDNGGIDYLDAILGPFTGRNMPPLVTADFVGLDVHKAIVDNLYQNTNDYAKETFQLPEYVENLIREGKIGRKFGAGLYKVEVRENGTKKYWVYDIQTKTYRTKMNYVFPFAEKMIVMLKEGDYETAFSTLINNHSLEAELCVEFLIKYVLYALKATELVGYDIHAADDVMAAGFNWCPPLAMIAAISGVKNFRSLVQERLDKELLGQIDLDKLLGYVEPSQYDYRRFLRAKH